MTLQDQVSAEGDGVGNDWSNWLASPVGQYLAAWEQAQIDRVVADVFGYHAVQLGTPELLALQGNRMPHRWLAIDHHGLPIHAGGEVTETAPYQLCCHFDALPFQSQSLDLVVLPHTLERAADPHQTLREVERVLVPEGRVVVTGFNPSSFWGSAHRVGALRRRLGSQKPGYLPPGVSPIGHRRMRDWLKLLGIHVDGGRFGCYVPPVTSPSWLQRMAWMDKTGDRWWPVFGAAYLLVAIKRVPGTRLVGLAKRSKPAMVKPSVTAPVEGRYDMSAYPPMNLRPNLHPNLHSNLDGSDGQNS